MAATRLAIIGAGELGLQLLDLSQNATDEFDVVGFFDDKNQGLIFLTYQSLEG